MESIHEPYSAEDWKTMEAEFDDGSDEARNIIFNACRREIDRLGDFILENMPDEIGKGDPVHGESAVDVAIRLMKQAKGIV